MGRGGNHEFHPRSLGVSPGSIEGRQFLFVFLLTVFQVGDEEKSERMTSSQRQSSSANIVLYVGLGMMAVGLVITFVGIGDKGFTATELKLLGPSLIGAGVFFCFLRIFFCTFPYCCRRTCPCCFEAVEKEQPPPPVQHASNNVKAKISPEEVQDREPQGEKLEVSSERLLLEEERPPTKRSPSIQKVSVDPPPYVSVEPRASTSDRKSDWRPTSRPSSADAYDPFLPFKRVKRGADGPDEESRGTAEVLVLDRERSPEGEDGVAAPDGERSHEDEGGLPSPPPYDDGESRLQTAVLPDRGRPPSSTGEPPPLPATGRPASRLILSVGNFVDPPLEHD